MKSPFKFLDAYELKDRAVFFGREEETEALYSMVFKTPLLLLYGLSGTGKTSLIRCGLASRFSAPNWYPFFIRRGEDLNHSIRQALSNALPAGKAAPETLKDLVSLLFRLYLRPVYLIFDQFEELFIIGSPEEQQAFAQGIRSLLEAELPCKIIFVMREEFIGQLYYLETEIPSIYDFRLRVEPMGMKKVQEVITGSLQHFQVQLADPAQNLQLMYNNISVGKSGVQLPYLQVYLDMFWREDFARTYPDPAEQEQWQTALSAEPPTYPPLEFTGAEIEAFGDMETVLARFLRQQEDELEAELKQKFVAEIPVKTVRSILDLFVTAQGTKQPQRFLRLGDHLQLTSIDENLLPPLPPGALSYALEYLYQARLLRERDDALELAHDSLAALIFREQTDEQRQVRDVIDSLQKAKRYYDSADELPGRKLLSDAESLLAILPLSPELRAFYDKSQAEWQRRDEAEKMELERRARSEEIAKRAEEEARLRQVAEKARRRATWGARVSAGLAILAIALGVVAYLQSLEADSKRKVAERLKKIAEENVKTEERQKLRIDSLRLVAKEETKRAERQTIKTEETLLLLRKETAEKEQLQFSIKADIVQSFVNAGYCELAQKALNDLTPFVKSYKQRTDFKETIKDLSDQVKNCKPLNLKK